MTPGVTEGVVPVRVGEAVAVPGVLVTVTERTGVAVPGETVAVAAVGVAEGAEVGFTVGTTVGETAGATVGVGALLPVLR